LHLFKELWCDPWLKKEPTSSVHASDLSVLAIEAAGHLGYEETEQGEQGGNLVHLGLLVAGN